MSIKDFSSLPEEEVILLPGTVLQVRQDELNTAHTLSLTHTLTHTVSYTHPHPTHILTYSHTYPHSHSHPWSGSGEKREDGGVVPAIDIWVRVIWAWEEGQRGGSFADG